MVTIVDEPDDIFLTLNEQEYTLQTDDYITTAGVKFTAVLVNSINPTDGLTLIVDFDTYSFTFIFKTTAVDDLDIQIPASPSGFNTVLKANIKTAFDKHFAIIDNYRVNTLSLGVLDIQARVAQTTALDITFTGTAISGGNLTDLGGYPVAGVTEVKREAFKIHAEIFIETSNGSGVYDKAIQERYTPDSDSTVIYDPAETLVSLCRYVLPAYNQNSPSIAALLQRFKIGYGDYYNDAVQWYRITAPKRALLGALTEAQIPGNTFYADHFTAATNQQFFTPSPRGELKTNKAAQQYLYYYQRTAYTTAYFVLYIDYIDGTGTVEDQLFILGQPDDVIILPAGYSQLDIDTLKTPYKTVKRWGIQVGANGINYTDYTDTTEIFWYTLDGKPFQNNRYLLFANSYGGMDTLWCNGIAEYGNKTEGDTYNVYKGTDTATVVGATEKSTFGTSQHPIKISTGFISRPYLEYIAAQLLFTTVAYEIVNGQYRAVIIDRKSIDKTHTDTDGKWELTFTYQYAQEDKG